MAANASWHARLAARLVDHWYRPRPSALARLLWPLSLAYGRVAAHGRPAGTPQPGAGGTPPLIVVGNLVAGGAGKTPVVIAVVQALRQAGFTPGVVSRGHGRRGSGLVEVHGGSGAAEVGDEPLLIHRRTAAPTWVARRRPDAVAALCAAHPDVDVLVSDDGLQHRALSRDVEVIVFDERGAGNGLLLPAGPLREPMPPRPPENALVLYNHPVPSTPWPGLCTSRSLRDAIPLADWLAGRSDTAVPLAALRGRPLVAAAGIAVPQRFFAMLAAAGLAIEPLPLPDHHRYDAGPPPWPATTPTVVTTEKDAVKLAPLADGGTAVWVVPLDLQLPPAFIAALLARLAARRPR